LKYLGRNKKLISSKNFMVEPLLLVAKSLH
jgi:hypothetical protein